MPSIICFFCTKKPPFTSFACFCFFSVYLPCLTQTSTSSYFTLLFVPRETKT
ncbi:hypothetical protein MBAV_002126 [Candidatus Magnetobacterium bavaricum]|uniref:Secreted protein n=1 Tax=Candidatus Magnetobacterium bavaricum TaxID=29290 RepID=A0A0F3GUP6_9BACT|nr:hypothetical protein MBAV_002126 [Candidatus Magnetobacterium bavaricum]